MKQLMMGACCAAFVLTFASYLVGLSADAEAKDRAVQSNPGGLLEQAGTQGQATAVTLEVVSSKNCSWCKKMKRETISVLVTMGYRVVIIPKIKDKRGTTAFPTLYYLDAKGNVVLKQIGFKTTKEVLKHLRKP